MVLFGVCYVWPPCGLSFGELFMGVLVLGGHWITCVWLYGFGRFLQRSCLTLRKRRPGGLEVDVIPKVWIPVGGTQQLGTPCCHPGLILVRLMFVVWVLGQKPLGTLLGDALYTTFWPCPFQRLNPSLVFILGNPPLSDIGGREKNGSRSPIKKSWTA